MSDSVLDRGGAVREGEGLDAAIVLMAKDIDPALYAHELDHEEVYLIGRRQLGVSANFVFENTGLVLIALNAAAILSRRRGRAAGVTGRG